MRLRFVDDFDKFWSVASKLIPAPPARHTSNSAPLVPFQSANSTMDRMPDGNGVRNVPLRVYLPHGGPVMQDHSPPIDSHGTSSLAMHVLYVSGTQNRGLHVQHNISSPPPV